MIRAIRIAIANYRLMQAEWDVAYWSSAVETSKGQLAKAERLVQRLRQAPNEIRYKLPRGVYRP